MTGRWIRTWVRRHRGQAIGLLLIAVIVAALLVPDTRELLNSNEGAIAGVLSALLVLLYFGQYQLQDRQIELENRPHIEIQEYEEDGKMIEIWLSNLGNGVATDLEIKTVVDFPEKNGIEPDTDVHRLRRTGEEGDEKTRVGNSMEAGEHFIKFVGHPVMGLKVDGRFQGYGLIAGSQFLAGQDIQRISIEFFVQGTDLLQNTYQENIYATEWTIELEKEGLNLEEMKAKRSPLGAEVF